MMRTRKTRTVIFQRREDDMAGRKRKAGPREANGRPKRASVREKTEDVMGVALAQRLRLVGVDGARSQLAEHPLGRLRLWNHINSEQYDAGMEFGKRLRLYGLVLGVDVTGPRTPWSAVPGAGTGEGPDMDEARANAVKRAYADVLRAVQELRFAGHNTGPVLTVMRKVCAREEGGGLMSNTELGDLRLGLNAVARALRLTSRMAG
ncbi:hypothetical protein GCM10007276_34550 [Agaricicola taiwanensis]|uniref:Uncharacterized protein n=1 Tax=Agaricicola taiwanensis TaxID=591372 RepID=A0A8J2YNF8_9RHOB|nr:hypothetical protein [Agaricicola taiwanensis]GGE54593.1 hypothetical protein GCM10007276_34550 [Agaricicola taiwanensis]